MNQRTSIAILLLVMITVTGVLVIVNLPPPVDVRIGYLTKDLHQLALRVAIVKGWFEQAGIRVELVQYANGAYEMDGFLAEQIDMGYLGVAPALTKSINQGIDIKILAGANLEGSALMVHKGEYDAGHIRGIEDLVGKTVLHPGPSTVQNFLLRLALNQSGISIENVTLETAIPANMAISLTPEKPAYIAWEPFPALGEYNNQSVPLLLSHDIWSRHPCCVLAVRSQFLSARPELVQQIVQIHKMAEEWIVENPTEAIEIATEWLGIDPRPVETAFNRIIFDYTVNKTAILFYLEFLIEAVPLSMDKSEAPAFVNTFVNTTFLESS